MQRMLDEKTGPHYCLLTMAMSTIPLRVHSLIVTVKNVFYADYTIVCFKGHQGTVTKGNFFFFFQICPGGSGATEVRDHSRIKDWIIKIVTPLYH